MDIFTLAVWAGTLIFLGISIAKDKAKTKQALKMAFGMGKGTLISMLSIIFAIGLILTLIPPAEISTFLSTQSVLLATVGGALLGTITLIPAFIAFPLIGTLIHAGVSVVPSVAFLTTLTMVGIVTFPLERKAFGTKFTAIRNGLSFLFAIAIALTMGVMI
jgi:uncharacterized membrane protein YraQ (UPF0718 family)